MSLSLIAWNPRIDEPSKPSPSVNTSAVSSLSGIEKCCQVPGRSQKRTSTTCTPASCALRMTSAGEAVGAFAPLAVVVGSNVAVIRASPPGSRVARASRAETTRARRREVPQLDRRKLPESLLDVTLLHLQEYPGRLQVPVLDHEVEPPAHGAQLAVRLRLEKHVPLLVAALQPAHVPGPFLAGKGDPHIALYATLRAPIVPVRFLAYDLPRVRHGRSPHRQVLPQMRRESQGRPRGGGLARRSAVGDRGGGGRRPADRAGDARGR